MKNDELPSGCANGVTFLLERQSVTTIGIYVHAEAQRLHATLASVRVHPPGVAVLVLPDGPDELENPRPGLPAPEVTSAHAELSAIDEDAAEHDSACPMRRGGRAPMSPETRRKPQLGEIPDRGCRRPR
jgi:hypothetical protein